MIAPILATTAVAVATPFVSNSTQPGFMAWLATNKITNADSSTTTNYAKSLLPAVAVAYLLMKNPWIAGIAGIATWFAIMYYLSPKQQA